MADATLNLLPKLRAESPLVQILTNYVSMDLAANAVLAVGASPAMVHAREEAAEFAELASAVVVNIGTASPPWLEAMEAVCQVGVRRGIPVVFDPVAVGATAFRREAGRALLAVGPTVVRGNASEILALAREGAHGGRGVDATDPVEAAVSVAQALSRQTGAVVAVTGPVDRVVHQERMAEISGGHPLMARVTAVGCALSAVTGAFCAVASDPFWGTVGALAAFSAAGAEAGVDATGPGSFRTRLVDALYGLQPEDLSCRITFH